MKFSLSASLILILSCTSFAAPKNKTELLVKLSSIASVQSFVEFAASEGNKAEKVTDEWVKLTVPASEKREIMDNLMANSAIAYVQPNYKIHLINDLVIKDPLKRAALQKMAARMKKSNPSFSTLKFTDNPAIPDAPSTRSGDDPQYSKQWGMIDNGVKDAWKISMGDDSMIVAVIDTGVDYTHEDLLPNLWRNTKEIPNNGIDDDKNGYVDDIIGWDFVSNDNKPYDLSVEPIDMLFSGGNPGHGTHCAGNVAARGENGIGISGVAPRAKIMSLRFISEKGSGTTADAVKALHYAVDNGAKITSNSWGSEGDPNDANEPENVALKEAIQYTQDKGTLFVAAAGNGRNGKGFSNDADKNPALPASYDFDSIISVAAIDNANNFGAFSNWGARTVDIAAPGVAVYSTMTGNRYSDVVIDYMGFHATWDGTSMATPHVAGAAALYWSAHPSATYADVKEAILKSAKKMPQFAGKLSTEGKLDVKALMSR